MGSILRLAAKSIWSRRGSALLTVLAIALAVALFLGVEKTRQGAKAGFNSTISGTDLIVGARTGQLNLLLYSVFRMGDATAEVSWPTYQWLDGRDDVAWTVPMSLGDSHRGFRVLGTTGDYFDRYKFGGGQDLELAQGAQFDDLFDAVIGADVAQDLGYELGSPLVLTHGLGRAGLQQHDDRPFRVAGILERTGTPVDRTLHVSLEAITAIHVGWETGTRNPLSDSISEEMIRGFDLTPKTVTAVLVGLERRGSILRTKREIDTHRGEAIMAILPGVALSSLWQLTGVAERALIAVSLFVVGIGLVSILTSILTSLNERRREMSVLRSIGARPGHIFFLIILESALLGALGALIGVAIVAIALVFGGPILTERYGLVLADVGTGTLDLQVLAGVTLAAAITGIIPAWLALRRSLADGLSIKI